MHAPLFCADFKLSTCRQCDKPILDQYIMKVSDMVFHSHCLRCTDCKHLLNRKCYSKDNAMYCEQDFFNSRTKDEFVELNYSTSTKDQSFFRNGNKN
uniref:LIM zinc-binding domain-containing protein n=1 Tax=Romanomermis culicivorax TaxID=13658 RepID=A0A915J6R0_ROMCU